MPVWLQAVFAIVVLASLVFIITGVVAIFKSRGRILRPWLLLAVGVITLFNVYQLTAPLPEKHGSRASSSSRAAA